MRSDVKDELRGSAGRINSIYPIASSSFVVFVLHHSLDSFLGRGLWTWALALALSALLLLGFISALAVKHYREETKRREIAESRTGWRKRVFQARWWYVATTPLWLPLELFNGARKAAVKVTGLHFQGPAFWAVLAVLAAPPLAKAGKKLRTWSSHRAVQAQVRDAMKDGAEIIAAAAPLEAAGELTAQAMATLLDMQVGNQLPRAGVSAYILTETLGIDPDLVRLKTPINRSQALGISMALEKLNRAFARASSDAASVAAGRMRNLTREELGLANRLFGGTLPADRVLLTTDGKFTCARFDAKILIHLDVTHFSDPLTTKPELLVHQLTHAWQFVHDGQFTGAFAEFAVLGAQIQPLCTAASEYETADLGVKAWSLFSFEQQAAIIEQWFRRHAPDFEGSAAREDPAYSYVTKNLGRGRS
jgi:hypothetical protein